MHLTAVDWAVIAGFFLLNIAIGFAYGRKSSGSISEYFLSGRNVPWWLAGTSMVATTFGADTPLAVTGMVVRDGIAGNWLWWNMVASGMLTVFFFAALWRRAGVMTDVELIELRYGGNAASVLRAFRAAYMALPVNCVVLGWVNLAMATILEQTLSLNKVQAVGICLILTGLYVSVSGLWGVLITDVLQFVVKFSMTVVLAVAAVRAAGGIGHIRETIPQRLSFVPDVSAGWKAIATFAVFLGIQWWASWYPGSEPGGGGYVAQRIFSARTERDGVLATLWFNIAHYTVRSWPWILTGLSVLVLYPGLQDGERGYVRVMIDHLPPSLRGLMMAGFLAAYMSTVATHLNWGASYLVGDLYKRFYRPDESERHYVWVSRAATLFTMVCAGGVTLVLGSIAGAWKLLLALGSGTGLVLILRWYWWRINAWSEISAMVASLIGYIAFRFGLGLNPDVPSQFAALLVGTLLVSTVGWLTVTFLTKPESNETLDAFFTRVRPVGPGWKTVADRVGMQGLGPAMPVRFRDWIYGCVLIYGSLLGTGKIILREYAPGGVLLTCAVLAGIGLARDLRNEQALSGG